MTLSEEKDRACNPCQEIVEMNEELEQDIRELYRRIVNVDSYYEEIYNQHCDLPGWDSIHQHLDRAVGLPEELLKVLPEE